MDLFKVIELKFNNAIKTGDINSSDILRYLKGYIDSESKASNKKITDEFCKNIVKDMLDKANKTKEFATKFSRGYSLKVANLEIAVYEDLLKQEIQPKKKKKKYYKHTRSLTGKAAISKIAD